MSAVLIHIYDYLATHRKVCHLSFVALTLALLALLSGQTYKEDISDFLPLGDNYQKAMKVYQQISGANRLFVTFQQKDTTLTDADAIVRAVEDYELRLRASDKDSLVVGLTTQIDIEKFDSLASFAYANIPYFLTDADYQRIDSALNSPDYVARQMAANKQMLMFPVSTLLADNMGRDPLNLFTPVVAKLQKSASPISYELYDGYIFTPDMQRAIIMLDSPFGSSETENNSRLLKLLQTVADSTTAHHAQLDIHLVGGPAIAVGNAQQIKRDSVLAVVLALVLIVGLLYYSFRSVRNLLLVVLSIAWGWLFAMGCLSVVHNNVSMIVIGISSVILGIAVNYPLHLIDHLRHTPHIRSALKEIVMPLLVGNVTTVGAFLALVPLKSVALRDLGLFSSFLLVGTILFVLIFLPHWVKKQEFQKAPEAPHSAPEGATNALCTDSAEKAIEAPSGAVGGATGAFGAMGALFLFLLTCVFGYFSLQTSFDANISHINYMTEQQQADMAYFSSMLSSTNSSPVASKTLYLVSEASSADEALDQSLQLQPVVNQLQAEAKVQGVSTCTGFLSSRAEQYRRLARWQTFVSQHGARIEASLRQAAREQGFADDSFDDFLHVLHADYAPQPFTFFAPLAQTAFASNLCTDSQNGRFQVIDQLTVAPDQLQYVVQRLEQQSASLHSPLSSSYVFDIESVNSAVANSLSDDFNYIGWACGLIVFLFLWFSMGSIELALLSFLPMAVSWVWILGIMALLGIQFNVVNVILATFIFGQGDDYTIFMTEGCQYEYAYRRPMLSSYKHSIMLSALIMFIGIGALIFARHPALRSLAQVTIVGMFSVVLMAWLLPPFIFRWLVSKNGHYRLRPITLRNLIRPSAAPVAVVLDRYRYKGSEVFVTVKRHLRRHHHFSHLVSQPVNMPLIVVLGSGYGEFALLMALTHPDKQVIAYEHDPDKVLLATYSAEGIAPNLQVKAPPETLPANATVFDYEVELGKK